MKRLLIFLGIIVLLNGCKTKTNLIEKAKNKMENLNSYTMTTNINSTIFYNNYSTTLTIDSNIDLKNNVGKFSITTIYSGNTSIENGYVKIDNNQIITYTNKDNNWYYSTDQSIFKFDILDNIKNKEIDASDNKIKISFDDDIIKNILNLDNNYIIDNDNTEIYLYITNDKYISQITMNVPLTINDDNIKSCIMNVTINFKNYNKLDNITIPDNVNSAFDSSVLTFIKNVEDYISLVEYTIYNTDLINSIYTNNNLNYDGLKPTSVNLNIENGIVINGNIIMGNYQFNIKNSKVDSFEKID